MACLFLLRPVHAADGTAIPVVGGGIAAASCFLYRYGIGAAAVVADDVIEAGGIVFPHGSPKIGHIDIGGGGICPG